MGQDQSVSEMASQLAVHVRALEERVAHLEQQVLLMNRQHQDVVADLQAQIAVRGQR